MGPSLASASPRPAASGTSASLSLLLDHTSLEVTRFQHIVNQFEKANPGITVSVENIADATAFYTKINTDGVGHTLPDVWYVRTFDVAYDALKGWTEPLDSYMAKTPGFNVNDFFPALRSQIAYDGKIYTLPWNLSDMIIFINKTIFQKAGVAIPSPDWNWDDFASTASKLSAKMSGQHYAGDVTNLLAGRLLGPRRGPRGQRRKPPVPQLQALDDHRRRQRRPARLLRRACTPRGTCRPRVRSPRALTPLSPASRRWPPTARG